MLSSVGTAVLYTDHCWTQQHASALCSNVLGGYSLLHWRTELLVCLTGAVPAVASALWMGADQGREKMWSSGSCTAAASIASGACNAHLQLRPSRAVSWWPAAAELCREAAWRDHADSTLCHCSLLLPACSGMLPAEGALNHTSAAGNLEMPESWWLCRSQAQEAACTPTLCLPYKQRRCPTSGDQHPELDSNLPADCQKGCCAAQAGAAGGSMPAASYFMFHPS